MADREWLRIARKRKRLSCEQMAEKLFMSGSAYQKYEHGTNGVTVISLQTAYCLSEILGLTVEQIAELEGVRRG